MTNQTGKVEDGSIKLPAELRQAWENADIYISGQGDHISIKRLTSPSLDTMLDELQEAGKNLSQDDIADALKSARKGNA